VEIKEVLKTPAATFTILCDDKTMTAVRQINNDENKIIKI
jgi:hypothetical protein